MSSLTKANEDYLEAILILEKKYDKVLSVDIAKLLGVSKPGVNRAMNVLKDNGLIEKSNYSEIKLTDEGRKLAIRIYDKHETIRKFLISLGVSEEIAERDCCLIEHVISDETYRRMKEFLMK